MQLRTHRRGRRLVAAAATLGLLGLPLLASTGADAAPRKAKAPAIKVMTRNIYLGADIMRPIVAIKQAQAQYPNDQVKQLDAFANANDVTRDIVDETDFDTRAKLLAGELVSTQPDLVGLQEVALWRHGPMDNPLDPATFLATNATEVDYDFLDSLLDETNALGAAQGIKYKAISVAPRADVEGPAYEGEFFTRTNARDVRLTMRDVILMRVGGAVKYLKGSKGDKVFDENLSFDLDNNEATDNAITFSRGYQWADMKAGDYRFRMLNTHFEAFGSDLAYAQAEELVDGAGGYDGTAVLTCDCNSDPALGTIKPGETKRHWAPYFLLKRQGDYNDTWEQWAAPEEGFTSGLSETVDDDTAEGFDHRIDFVFARTANGDKLPVLNGWITGNEVGDRDSGTGLWPSDHAGVVTKLRLR